MTNAGKGCTKGRKTRQVPELSTRARNAALKGFSEFGALNWKRNAGNTDLVIFALGEEDSVAGRG